MFPKTSSINRSNSSEGMTGGLAVISGLINADSTVLRSSIYCSSLEMMLWMILGTKPGEHVVAIKLFSAYS